MEKAPMDSIVHYNAACLYALAGEVEKSLDCLENCYFKVGNLNREWLEHDSDLDNVRDHPRFPSYWRHLRADPALPAAATTAATTATGKPPPPEPEDEPGGEEAEKWRRKTNC